MNASSVIRALELPDDARVDRRVPKKLLVENGAPTAADKRQINEKVEEIRWVAAIKPSTSGVSEYRDASRDYLEIAVITLTLRDGAKVRRLSELVHRAVPYLVVLIAVQEPVVTMSLAHKRWSQNEPDKTVLDSEVVALELESESRFLEQLLAAIAFGSQPQESMYSLYQGWLDTLLAVHAARLTGQFTVLRSPERAATRREALRTYATLEAKIDSLRSFAEKEKQLPRRAELNSEVSRLREELKAARERL